jgi:hypothetical protein
MFAATLVAGLTVAAPALRASTIVYHAQLSTTDEVPPKSGDGKGDATVTLDTVTREVDFQLMFSGLTGPATMAHIHGPAEPGKNAPVQVVLGMNPSSPVTGSATLTPEQMSALEAGKMYVNVHTKANPGGEIRGQLTKSD